MPSNMFASDTLKARSRAWSTLLGSVSAVALFGAAPTLAQDADAADENSTDTIVITGIRGSLERAADIKRAANGVTDAISAEDIGKFPNTNLAESLQRIPGVSIDRVNGEGSQITVRGFGSGFNLVTLNGRTMPTANVAFVGTNADNVSGNSRNFDFANLASEGVSTLEVTKTGKAIVPSGGLGATVNIRTPRPLDNPGTRGSIGAKAVYDTSVVQGDDITPEVSGLFSWTDDDERFGVSVFGSFQQRDSGAASSSVASWNIFSAEEFLDPGNGLVSDATQITNLPTDLNTLVSIPRDSRYFVSDISRERINGQAVFQFNPSETLRFTADILYANNQEEEQRAEASNWFNRPFSEVVFDDNPVVATPVFLAEEINGVKDYAVTSNFRATEETLESFGFNAEWDLSDNFMVVFDGHTSKAESTPDGPLGFSEFNTGLAAPVITAHSQTNDGGDVPFQNLTIDDSLRSDGDGVLTLNDVSTTIATNRAVAQTNEVDEFDVRGVWDVDDRARVTFGVNYRSQSNETDAFQERQTLGNWGADFPGDVESIAPGALEVFCLTCEFDDFAVPTDGASAFGVRGNAAEIFQAVTGVYAADPFNSPIGVLQDDFNSVEEDVISLFAQIDNEFELGGRPAYLSAGLRYEETEVTSSAVIAVPEAVVWTSDNDFDVRRSAEALSVSAEGEYENFLPHVDLKVDVTDDLVARASYSTTISRTGYGNLFFSDSPNAPPGPTAFANVATGSSGNPGLTPLESDNFDISVEWYFDDSSYVSIGAFEKRVSNFVGTGQTTRTLFDLRDPSSGAAGTRSGDALAAINDIGAVANDVNLFGLTALIQERGSLDAALAEFQANLGPDGVLDQGYVDGVVNGFDVIADASDPLFLFEVTQPINQEQANINGIELAGQYFFGDTGFGIAGSYTLVEGDVGFDVGADPSEDQFALTGLSDTFNVTLIYENFGLSTRLAYNWRDEFLASANVGTGFRNPLFVDEFGQLDLSVTYDLMDKVDLSFEAINLTGENLRTFGRSESNMWFAQELDPRYLFGARYKF